MKTRGTGMFPFPSRCGGSSYAEPAALPAIERSGTASCGRIPERPIGEASENRLYALFEVVASLALFTVLVWGFAPRLDHPLLLGYFRLTLIVAAIYVVYVAPVHIHSDGAARRGLGGWRTLFVRTDNLAEAAVRFAALLAAGVGAMLLYLACCNGAQLAHVDWGSFFVKLAVHTPFVIAQDVFFFGFVLLRLDQALATGSHGERRPRTPDRSHLVRVSLTFALLFALFHIPNITLMLLCLGFGAVAGWLFLLRPNIAAIVVCHVLLGTFLHRVVELHTRIGPFYSNPDQYVVRRLFPFLDSVINGRF